MAATPSTAKFAHRNNGRAAQRYRYIKMLLDCRGQTVRDLYRRYSAYNAARHFSPVEQSVFYRVCQGKTTSARVRKYVARALHQRYAELWS